MSNVGTILFLIFLAGLVSVSLWDSRREHLRRKEERGVLPVQVICDQCGKPLLVQFRGELRIKNIQPTSRYDPPIKAPVAECPICHTETPITGDRGHKLLELVSHQ